MFWQVLSWYKAAIHRGITSQAQARLFPVIPSHLARRSLFKRNYSPLRKMNWLILFFAGLFEVSFTFCLGKANGTTGNEMYLWLAGFLVTLSISMGLLIKATQTLPIGTAYAVWTGIGAVGTVLVGIFVFKEPTNFLRLFFLTTLILSIIGLKTVSH
ncbi:MAG: multidrug efflux SMR transporter [Desulfofustis sp.]|nr:multidrug efflux SMR transporter [Desulfofustis sp.]